MAVSPIEVGKWYKTRGGHCALIVSEIDKSHYKYSLGYRFVEQRGGFFTPSGNIYTNGQESVHDLVEEIDKPDIVTQASDKQTVYQDINLDKQRIVVTIYAGDDHLKIKYEHINGHYVLTVE